MTFTATINITHHEQSQTYSVSAGSARLPFREQIEFFRRKVKIPTASWTDIWQSQHDVAFVVAGAARDDLLNDLHQAVDGAISEGTTLAKFKKDFGAIVDKHGWRHTGGRDWRARVIYNTNLRTSYSAGRWQQIQAVKDTRPYVRYRHSHAVVQPREMHLSWDGLVLSVDDPWLRTHAPTNGWGCQCFLESLSERNLEKLGKSGPDTAPAIRYRTVTVGKTGPTPRTVRVPEGIDPGFAYAPGRVSQLGEAVRHRLQRSIVQAPGIASAGVRRLLSAPGVMAAHEQSWNTWRQAERAGVSPDDVFVLAAADEDTMRWLNREKKLALPSAAITVTRREAGHLSRSDKRNREQGLSEADVNRLPTLLHDPEAVLYDNRDAALLYVFPRAEDGLRDKGKIVVRMNYSRYVGRHRKITTNSVRTAGYVSAHNLREPHLDLIRGEID